MERYYGGTWHSISPTQNAQLEPHLRLERRMVWINGARTNIGGHAVKTSDTRRVRCPDADEKYRYYIVDRHAYDYIFR